MPRAARYWKHRILGVLPPSTPPIVVTLCAIGQLCMNKATAGAVLSANGRRARPLACCDEHRAEVEAKAREAGVDLAWVSVGECR